MSSPDAAFEKLVGRRATDGERQRLYRVRDTLGIKSTDAVWTLLLALEYYLALYEKIPRRPRARREYDSRRCEGDRRSPGEGRGGGDETSLDRWRARDRERDRQSRDRQRHPQMGRHDGPHAVGRHRGGRKVGVQKGGSRGAGSGGSSGDAGLRAQGRRGVLGEHGGWATRLRPDEGGYASRHGHVLGARAIGPRWLVHRARRAGKAVPMAIGRRLTGTMKREHTRDG